jgi:hypothetical protein
MQSPASLAAIFLVTAHLIAHLGQPASAQEPRQVWLEDLPSQMGTAWTVADTKTVGAPSSSKSSPSALQNKSHQPPKVTKAKSKTAGAAKQKGKDQVVVNGVPLTKKIIKALERTAGGSIQPGRYWYDTVSGLWGVEGGPIGGQIAPHLDLGGPLKADVSQGKTGVFINGRELPIQEVVLLRHLGEVMPGRYWMNAEGIGGFENGPAVFNIRAGIEARIKQGGGVSGGWNRTTPGGHLGGDDNCSYFFDPKSGSSAMNCK